MSNSPPVHDLLIVSLTPQNFERANLPCPPNAEHGDAGGWFSEEEAAIKKAIGTNPWWQGNALFIEKDRVLKPAEFSRKLIDFGYERSQTVYGRGAFAPRGGIIEVWPLNRPKPYLIEFDGNVVREIRERPESEEKIKPRIPTQTVENLKEGSFVVHVDHGIGVYRGTTSANYELDTNLRIRKFLSARAGVKNSPLVDDDGDKEKYYLVEYASPAAGLEPDKLYVPVEQKERLSPYIGFETPRVHRLGGNIWQTTKRKARQDVEKLARELLTLYAKRDVARREPYDGDASLEESVKEGFPFEETPDQLRAEEEILRDLSSQRPMDRVLCGDVGFGKTEIALRAALRVMASGKQAAILAPTTILAAQHEETIRERLRDLPFEVAALSRLTPKKDEDKILRGIADGTTDCVIGTHRILSRDIVFKKLGLLVIDEEQRFGVKQKEKLKSIRAEIDILALSATPIPRTLSLALAGLRDISRLSTPPPNRLSIATLVLPHSKKTIATALKFEIERGGQIYFLHNRIETIGEVKKKLHKLVKNIRIEVIHGRMGEQEIMRSMDRFRRGECDVLLATTIIENGLDISNANTLVVDDATRLGLAEAHQLRGRIGRAQTQGFAYFLYKPRHMTLKAEERLLALREYSELGAGYEIALCDLEIRGSGNILGREQSGTINKIGLNLYYHMLSEAIEQIKDNKKEA